MSGPSRSTRNHERNALPSDCGSISIRSRAPATISGRIPRSAVKSRSKSQVKCPARGCFVTVSAYGLCQTERAAKFWKSRRIRLRWIPPRPGHRRYRFDKGISNRGTTRLLRQSFRSRTLLRPSQHPRKNSQLVVRGRCGPDRCDTVSGSCFSRLETRSYMAARPCAFLPLTPNSQFVPDIAMTSL